MDIITPAAVTDLAPTKNQSKTRAPKTVGVAQQIRISWYRVVMEMNPLPHKKRLLSYDFEIVGADYLVFIIGRCAAECYQIGVPSD